MKRSGPLQRHKAIRRTARLELRARGVDKALRDLESVEKRITGELVAVARVVDDAFTFATRGLGLSPVKLRAVPKALPPFRSVEYRRWVALRACVSCARGRPSVRIEAMHFGPRGVGEKTDDTRVVPGCRECHRFETVNGYLPLDGPSTITLVRAQKTPGGDALVARLKASTRLLVAEAALAAISEWHRKEARDA